MFPQSTVLQNVLIGLHLKLETRLLSQLARIVFRIRGFYNRENWAISKAMEIIESLGLREQRNELARNLPLADQRKLEICIALATDPELLLLDEPAAGIPVHELTKLTSQLKILHAKGMTIILVDHNMKFVMNLCQRIVALHHGAKIAEGTPVDIVSNPEVRRIYLAQESSYARN